MWCHMPASFSTIPQQPSSSGAHFQPLWTTTPAQGMAAGNSKCYGHQRFRREYIISPHGREGWQQAELLSGTGEATQKCVERHKETAFINPTQTHSHHPPLGFGHNWIKYEDYSLSVPQGLLPTSCLHSTKGATSCFSHWDQTFPSGYSTQPSTTTSQTNPLMSERWQTPTKTSVLLSTIQWRKIRRQSLEIHSPSMALFPSCHKTWVWESRAAASGTQPHDEQETHSHHLGLDNPKRVGTISLDGRWAQIPCIHF